jgi:hypothetical protein
MKTLPILLLLGLTLVSVIGSDTFAQSPGDTIGWTQYPYQCYSSTGHRIALDDQGSRHFTWMISDAYPSIRDVAYACLDSAGNYSGTRIGVRNGSGYSQIALTSDNRAAVVYHIVNTGAESLYYAIDQYSCLNTFIARHPPNRIGSTAKLAWPFLTIDRNDRVHLVATDIIAQQNRVMGYTRSNNGGTTWTALIPVDTVMYSSAILVSSPVSDKVSIVYCHPIDSAGIYFGNNVFYIQSQDGITWDWQTGKINITNYGRESYLFAYLEVEALYDYNDNLHIVYTASGFELHGEDPRVWIFHFDVASGAFSLASLVQMPANTRCDFGNANLAVSKISMAADSANGMLYIVYSRFDTLDCSANMIANGELYTQHSSNGGIAWSVPVDLTNTHTPGCSGGNCASEVYPSIASRVDDYLHIFYQLDKGFSTSFYPDDPLLYFKLSTESQSTGIGKPLPIGFKLSQNYPNPFNGRTIISYNLPHSTQVNVSIFNILGQKVTTLFDGIGQSGENSIVWDAQNVSSGIYYTRLQVGDNNQSIRMMLLK